VYSTYFTSIWIWLYAVSGFLMKGARILGLGLDTLRMRFLNVSEKPFMSIGFAANCLITGIYVAVGMLSLVF
jgi:hypothetical protein